MLGHSTRSRRGRCAADTASPRANGRDARCDARAARRGSAAGRPAPRASRRRAPPRSPRDTRPRSSRGSARNPARDQPLEQFIDLEQFGDEAPAPVEPVGHPPRALLGAVAEPHRPFARQLAVIGDFLDRLGRDLAQERVAGLRSAAGRADAARSRTATAARSSARNRRWAARPAGNCGNRARRGGRRAGRHRPRCAEQMRRLPDQVEREVGQAQIDLERRRVAAPFAEPLAEDQRIVAQPQQIIGRAAFIARLRTSGGSDRRHQMCFTSSGMS